MGKLIRYPLLAFVLLLPVLTAAHVAFAERPDTCAPEDREVPGNINSDCKWDFHADEITTVEYTVVENAAGNSCHERLTFSPFDGTAEWEGIRSVRIPLATLDEQGIPRRGDYAARYALERTKAGGLIVATANTIQILVGYNYTLDSSIPQSAHWPEEPGWSNQYDSSFYDVLRVRIPADINKSINQDSKWLPMPSTINDFNLLMNDCLAGIKQRLENEAKLEETRQQVEAERVAQERTAKQAAAEAERQRLETEAASEALRLVRGTELAKTQALIEQLEREKIIIGIWQEVVVEKQTGAEARAEITNRYLVEIEANAADFKASVVAKAEEIRRLQEINAAITAAIIAHNGEVERQLSIQEAREAEQRDKLDELHIEPPEAETPAPTAAASQ